MMIRYSECYITQALLYNPDKPVRKKTITDIRYTGSARRAHKLAEKEFRKTYKNRLDKGYELDMLETKIYVKPEKKRGGTK